MQQELTLYLQVGWLKAEATLDVLASSVLTAHIKASLTVNNRPLPAGETAAGEGRTSFRPAIENEIY